MKYNAYHVNRESQESDRLVNEYGSRRPPRQVLVGAVEAADRAKAIRLARTQFPAPDGWSVFCRPAEGDEYAALGKEDADALASG